MSPSDPINRVNLGKVFRLQGRQRLRHEEFLAAWQLDKLHPAPANSAAWVFAGRLFCVCLVHWGTSIWETAIPVVALPNRFVTSIWTLRVRSAVVATADRTAAVR